VEWYIPIDPATTQEAEALCPPQVQDKPWQHSENFSQKHNQNQNQSNKKKRVVYKFIKFLFILVPTEGATTVQYNKAREQPERRNSWHDIGHLQSHTQESEAGGYLELQAAQTTQKNTCLKQNKAKQAGTSS
jgi:hypothetical protein